MLGRTHMAIGAAASCIITPAVLHAAWFASPVALQIHDHSFVSTSGWLLAALIGSTLPDLDESHSILARKAEVIGRLVLLAITVLAIVITHAIFSYFGWGLLALFAFSLLAKANLARKAALVALAAACLYAGMSGIINAIDGVFLVVWLMGTAFTSHRTFTHSLLGIGVLGYATIAIATAHGLSFIAVGALLGYVFHIAADLIAGGVPLFWPWKRRLGITLVKTGGAIDQLIGGAAIVAVPLLLVFRFI